MRKYNLCPGYRQVTNVLKLTRNTVKCKRKRISDFKMKCSNLYYSIHSPRYLGHGANFFLILEKPCFQNKNIGSYTIFLV